MLKRQNCYLLKKVNDTYWLLPYGQAVADQKKGCQLNETGVFIWQALEHPMSEDQLIQKLAEHYGIEDADRISLSGDIHDFIHTMLQMHFLSETLSPLGLPLLRQMKIADLNVGLYGEPDLFPSDFESFYTETSSDAALDQLLHLIPCRILLLHPALFPGSIYRSLTSKLKQSLHLLPGVPLDRFSSRIVN